MCVYIYIIYMCILWRKGLIIKVWVYRNKLFKKNEYILEGLIDKVKKRDLIKIINIEILVKVYKYI